MSIYCGKLSEEELKEVNGGYIFIGRDAFEVIDDKNGEVLGKYSSFNEAREAAKKKGQSATIIYWDELNKLRSN